MNSESPCRKLTYNKTSESVKFLYEMILTMINIVNQYFLETL